MTKEERQAKVYEVIGNLIVKAIVALAVVGVWVWTTYYTMKTGSILTGVSATVLSFAFKQIVNHYFPPPPRQRAAR